MPNLFKFTPGPNGPTDLEGGEVVNNAESIVWTERYRDAGDFKIKAPLSSGLREFLPIGTFVSHSDTFEVMIVENHHIKEDPDKDPALEISGRSFESWLENRVTGLNQVRASNLILEYELSADNSWDQAVQLVNDHVAESGAHAADFIPDVFASSVVPGSGTSVARTFPREDVYRSLKNLLVVDNIGVKTHRPHSFAGSFSPTAIVLVVHNGVDHSDKVIFSVKSGDLDGAEYLWSDKTYKNAAVIVGQYINVFSAPTWDPKNFYRKYLIVDGSDIDGRFDAAPTGGTLTNVMNKMQNRGLQAITNQNRIALIGADISELSKYEYRKDYNIGDIVTVDASYGQMRPMRVIEFTEIMDENEYKAYPTLELPEPE